MILNHVSYCSRAYQPNRDAEHDIVIIYGRILSFFVVFNKPNEKKLLFEAAYCSLKTTPTVSSGYGSQSDTKEAEEKKTPYRNRSYFSTQILCAEWKKT